jgi:signal transduction histidine kinase
MFTRMYLQIVAILTASMLTLLVLVGSLVYFELKYQMAQDGKDDLQTEISNLQGLIPSLSQVSSSTHPVRSDLGDDRGLHLYFVVFERDSIQMESFHQPIPGRRLRAEVPAHKDELTYKVVEYHERPYRVAATAWVHRGRTYQMYLYQSLDPERKVLQHAFWLIILSGGLGAFLAILFYLWLSHRVLRPVRESWRAQQRMLVELSHELQTPLATMNAIAASQIHDDVTRGKLAREIRQASELVSDILYLSRLDGMPAEEREPVAVSDITEEVAERIRWLAERQGIQLTGSAEQGLFVQTTPDEWRRLVSTLLKNVVDHAQPATHASWKLWADSRQVRFTVENEYDREAKREDVDRARGFGLHIVRRLVQAMGGSFTMEVKDRIVRAEVSVPRLLHE